MTNETLEKANELSHQICQLMNDKNEIKNINKDCYSFYFKWTSQYDNDRCIRLNDQEIIDIIVKDITKYLETKIDNLQKEFLSI